MQGGGGGVAGGRDTQTDRILRVVFPQQFRVLPNFHECYHNSMETQGKRFLLFFFYEIKALQYCDVGYVPVSLCT